MAWEADQNQPAKKPTLSTDQEEEQQGQDFISLLPDQILHTILSKLQFRDAAVTTAVSKRWAPLFPTLPSLLIDAASFNPRDSESDPIDDFSVHDSIKWVDALFSVLDSRKTAVKKFDIAVDVLGVDPDFYEVFRDVCVAGVEELSIFNTNFHDLYRIPSPVFACNTIVKLEIISCKLKVPSHLTGLRAVKSLVLSEVTVVDDHLRRMISRCKAMEKLVIYDCRKVKNIVIRAPSLSELVISSYRPVGVVLKSVPQLASMKISYDYDPLPLKKCDPEEGTDDEESDYKKPFEGTNEVINLLSCLNGLRRVEHLDLSFSKQYRVILSKAVMALPTRLSPKCYLVKLKKLRLRLPFNYNNMKFNMIISCLLNSSPHLMEIIISEDTDLHEYKYRPNDLELNFWEKQLPAKCVKHHLTTATFYLSEDCLGFPKFLLQNAGNLKNMNLIYGGNVAEKIKNELFAIQKSSPDVEIMIK
ncbi:F-box protein [Carex littledalei]|uniref:F-box protein n=1 Tax=Carex littledalei TaxID=544730 RepID=A0A833RS24_9POAL|nr:F-box protein [Carex littledalei]